MLPDFPEQKSRLIEFLRLYLKLHKEARLGPLADIPLHTHHEGRKSSIRREDGSEVLVQYENLELRAEEIDPADIKTYTLRDVFAKMEQLAEELATSISKATFQEINRVAEEIGNVVNASKSPSQQAAFLEAMEKVEVSFSENGQLQTRIWANSSTASKLGENMLIWVRDPEFKKKYDQIIDKKRWEWHVREGSRKLVD